MRGRPERTENEMRERGAVAEAERGREEGIETEIMIMTVTGNTGVKGIDIDTENEFSVGWLLTCASSIFGLVWWEGRCHLGQAASTLFS